MTLIAAPANASALVVGASQGIGLGFVRRLLQERAITTLFATYRSPDTAVELLDLAAQFPQRLRCLTMDITDETQIAARIEQIRTITERLYLAINCVGFLHVGAQQPEKSLRQIQSEHLLRYFQVNSIGAILLAKHLLPLFDHPDRSLFATLSAKIGSIGDNRLGGWYGYRASKAALNMLLKTAAIEYRRKSPNTLVVMLHPGTTNTQLSQPFQRNVPPEQLFSVERTVEQLIEVLQNLKATDSGAFFSWDGSRLPW